MKRITKTIENGAKEQIGGFLGILLGTSGAYLLGNMQIRKGMLRAGFGKGMLRAAYGNKMNF